jgi:ubiquinone biosynthesis protein
MAVYRSLRVIYLATLIFFGYGSQLLLSRYFRSWAWVERRWLRLHAINARRIAQRFSELGGVFIKMGQVLSVMAPVLPPIFGTELSKLQDAVPPRPFAQMRPRLVDAWGDGFADRFGSIDESPLAAASLAQVHRATLRDGSAVVLKILYPDIETLVRNDLRTVRKLLPGFRVLFGFRDSAQVLAQLSAMLEHEMDYRREQSNIERLREILKGNTKVVIPRVVEELSTRCVLVLSYEAGTKVHDPEVLRAAGIEPEAIAGTLVQAYITMLFEHRVFHADPHPGNLLARPDGSLVLLDFGAVEEASQDLTDGLKEVVLGALTKNTDQVMAGVERMGFIAVDGNRQVLRKVAEQYLAVLSEVKVQNFAALSSEELVQLSGANILRGKLRTVAASVSYPPGYFYVERTLTLLFGVTARLVPTKGLLAMAAPYTSKLMLRAMAERKKTSPVEAARLS